jgi:hypothetical protein
LHSTGKHATVISAMAFTRDGRGLMAGGNEGDLRFWNLDLPAYILEISSANPCLTKRS